MLYDKAREISTPLRQGVAESLVLLSIHGSRLFGKRFGREPEHAVANLVQGLLTPLTPDGLLSQSSNLPLYAEAAPEVFLRIFEQDLVTADPVVKSLMSPANHILFERGDRVDLVWALELLAWRPEWLARVVALLGALAELEPNDNLANKPSASLQAIFRSWMPQTAAPVELRIAVFDNTLVKEHPAIAWQIANAQFDPGQRYGDYSQKPRWRDYALGFGEPVNGRDRHAFVIHCIETCLGWRPHDRGKLADLMEKVESLGPEFVEQLWNAVVEWAQDASDQDSAWLRERIRVSTGRTIRRNSREKPSEEINQGVSMARKAFDLLEPADPIWKHAWLFQNAWVDESWDELEEEDLDIEARDRRTHSMRVKAAAEVFAECGYPGLLQLALSGNAAYVVGWAATEAMQPKPVIDLLDAVLRDGDVLTSAPHQSFVSGVLKSMDGKEAISLAQQLWPQFGRRVGVKLLCLCEFDRLAWSEADRMGEDVADEYWANVSPSWGRYTRDDLNFAVSRLLEASRPSTAFDLAHLDWGRVESTHIRRTLIDLPRSVEPNLGRGQLDAYNIQEGLKVLNERAAFSQTERAQLEFQYLELFWREEDRLPNLEKEIEDRPELFCEAIALVYRREDERASREPTPDQARMARVAFHLLDKLANVPGRLPDGTINATKLMEWVAKAQELCEKSGHKQMGDEQIGQLLANAPTGADDVWPCVPVREALEMVLNDDIQAGFVTGRRNSRGVQIRGEGGAQERELATQYGTWAKACDYVYPRVAAALRELESSYEAEAQWHDRDSAVEKRLGY